MNKLEKIIGKLENIETEGPIEKSKYYAFISNIMKFVHSQIPDENYNVSKVAVPTDIREEYFQGDVYKRAVMYLMSNGCEWAINSANGCTMCGHLAKQARNACKITAQEFLMQFNSEFEKIDFGEYPLLNLYNNGSFLNDNEIPPEARREILKRINMNPDIKMLVLETRPEYVNEKNICEIKSLIPDKHVEIAIGLEMKNDLFRTVCINKGFSLKQYNNAAEIIAKHLWLRTYVLLKPPFLTEKEGIDSAVNTIKHAFEMGSSTVSLEGCTVQNYTLVKLLKEKGYYSTPWLWSIVDVIKKTSDLGKLIVGLFQFFPNPNEVPYNCDNCSMRVIDAIKKYNRELKYNVFEGIYCDCKEKWVESLTEKALPFSKRIEILAYINNELNGTL